MFLRGLRFLMAPDEGGGAATEETVETTETPEVEETAETTETPEGEETDTETEETTETVDPATGQPSKPAKGAPPQSVPYARFKEVVDEFRAFQHEVKGKLGDVDTIRGEVDRLRPPEKDPIDLLFESVSNAKEGTEDFAVKENLEALGPATVKRLREVMQPADYRVSQAVLAGTLQALDRMNFVAQQLQAIASEDASTEEGAARIAQAKAALKSLDRINEHRQAVHKATGKIVRHADAFKAVSEQLKAETAQQSARDGQIRQETAARTEKEVNQRRGASGGTPTKIAAAPRGTSSHRTRSFEELDRIAQEGTGGGILLP